MATAAMSSALPAHHLDAPPAEHDDPTTAAAPASSQEAALEAAEVTLDASDVAAAAAAAGNYATPHRRGALPAVTPAAGGEDGPDADDADHDQEDDIAAVAAAVVSAASAESSASPVKSKRPSGTAHSPPRKQLVQPRAVAPSPLSVARAQSSIAPPVRKSAAAATRKIKSIATKPQQLKPSIQLGPRVTPAVRKAPPPRPAPRPAPVPKSTAKAQNKQQKPGVARQNSSSPINPRNLEGALQKGQPRGITAASTAGSASSQAAKFRAQTRALSQLASAATDVAHAAASHQASQHAGAVGGTRDCPTTPARQVQSGNIPAPSSFLAAKISPLRSSARNRAKAAANAAVAGELKRESTPPPQGADPKLSPGMFLSPRTPRTVSGGMGGTKSSGMTPRFTPGLTPTNFASDFGRGERKEGTTAQGGMSTLDASNVFAWLQTPTLGGAGMFSPSGGLHSLDTPRGMYGFQAPPGTAAKAGNGPPVLGDLGVDTPHIPESQRSMICISPLASRRSKDKAKAAAAGTAPDTPLSINFSEVFASPRFPSPRASRPPPGAHAAEGSADAHASPVASALHTAERDVNLDDDLHALLQLAETTTPGGRPHMLLSPLLTNSLRRAHGQATPPRDGGAAEPPMGLQLPIISGSSVALAPGSARKLSRKGSHGGAGGMPQLAIRTTSSGGTEGAPSPVRSSANPGRKRKKRKSPPPAPEHYDPAGMAHYHGHPHPPMAPSPQHGYYHRPGYPAPPGHLSYPSAPHPPQYGASPVKEASPAKATAKKAKSSRSRSRSRAKAPAKAAAGDLPASRPGTPASAAGSSAGRRARKPARSAAAPRKPSSTKNAPSSPAERERIAIAIRAVNTVYGEGDQKKRKLAAATLRGVTMRPSGKWQAQLYYAGKSRYIGVFDSKEKASLAYEVAREVLKEEKGEGAPNADDTDRNVALARKAAFAGVNGA